MLRFLTSVTLRATVLTGVVGTALLAVSWPLAERAIVWIIPEGSTLMLTSPGDIDVHRAVALFAFALGPAFGWLVAAARGFRRNTRSDLAVIATCTGVVTAVGAVGAALQMSSLHNRWVEASAQIPWVDLGSLDHWTMAIFAMVVAAAALLVVVLRPPKLSDPRTRGPA